MLIIMINLIVNDIELQNSVYSDLRLDLFVP